MVCNWDNMVGWMDPKHLHFISEKEFRRAQDQHHYNLELIYGIVSEKISIPITIGAVLHQFDGINVKMPFGRFRFSGQVLSPDEGSLSTNMFIKLALKFLNAPQMRGGRSILGLDADAYVQLVYKLLGINLPRQAAEQASCGEDIGFLEHARIGDLVFFSKSKSPICHVGLIVGPMSVIHCHGRVKIDRVDQQGLFDLERGRYTYTLRTVRRLIQFVEAPAVTNINDPL